jgi:Glycosyltransferase family 87
VRLNVPPKLQNISIGVLYAGLLFWGAIVIYTALFNQKMGWDFKVYYSAATAYSQERDPYDWNVLANVSDGEVTMPFVYPPLVLPLIRPLTFLSKDAAFFGYTFAKIISLILLVFLWAKVVLPDKHWLPVLFLVCAVGFRETITRDLYAGNVAIFEQLALWCGIAALLRGRYLLFAIAVVVASLCKPPLIVFLALAFFADDRRKAITNVASAFLIFCFLHMLSLMTQHELYLKFLKNVGGLDERGGINPASLALFRDVAESLFSRELSQSLAVTIWGVFVIGVIALAIWLYRKSNNISLLDAICAFILVFALISPRMKNYSYIVCIIPAVRVITIAASPPLFWLLLGFTCIGFFPYQPLFVALVLFVVMAFTIPRVTVPPASIQKD